MIAWLSDWLRDIIAVILLAAFVELLLPNKAMLRYTRLVIGLIILLTIMSPILRLLQGDFNAKLNAGITHWDQLEAEREVKMPSLTDIQKKAEELNRQQNSDAAALMEQTLESAMKDAVVQQTKQVVEAVDVTLKWEQQGQKLTPYIKGVVVTLPAETKSQAATETPEQEDVKEVAAIQVDVNAVDINRDKDGLNGRQTVPGEEKREEGWVQASTPVSKTIRSLLAEGWGVNPGSIEVRQRAETSE